MAVDIAAAETIFRLSFFFTFYLFIFFYNNSTANLLRTSVLTWISGNWKERLVFLKGGLAFAKGHGQSLVGSIDAQLNEARTSSLCVSNSQVSTSMK